MHYPTLYTTWEALTQIYSQREYESFKLTSFDYMNVALDLTEEEMERLKEDELFQILQRQLYSNSRDIVALKEYFFDCLDEQNWDAIATDFLILSNSIDDCKKLREEKGLFVINESELDFINRLFKSEDKTLHDGDHYRAADASQINGWSAFLNNLAKFKSRDYPINAMIIFDRYLFDTNLKSGVQNIISLCCGVIHPSLAEEFHLTLVCNNKKSLLTDKVVKESIFKPIADEVLRITGKKIALQIVVHKISDELHDRYIHTNYYSIYSEPGFDTFINDRARRRQKVEVRCYFSFIAQNHSEGMWHELNYNMDYLKPMRKRRPVTQAACNYLNEVNYGDKDNRLFYHF